MQLSNKKLHFVSATTTRVPRHTPDYLNERIMQRSMEKVEYSASDPGRLEERLSALDREWDIERVLEANASSLVVMGTLLGYLVNDWFYWIPLLVGIFLLQHAIQGWCPPIRLFRRIGFRTHAEIATEYYSLRALRGDFDELPGRETVHTREQAKNIYRLMSWPPEIENPQDTGSKTNGVQENR